MTEKGGRAPARRRGLDAGPAPAQGQARDRSPLRAVALARLPVPALVIALLAACNAEQPPPEPAPQAPEGLEAVVPAPDRDPVLPDPAPPVTGPPLEAPGVATLVADTVQGWTGPGGQPFEVALRTPGRTAYLHTRIGRESFALPARLPATALTQYPCTSCHEGTVDMGDRIEDAHRNIQPRHPQATGATCATCHVADSVQRLTLHDGSTVSMDHAYRLCAQCHSPETRAWAAGIHGKRLEGWAGRRVVMNCTDCHDPHTPALEARIPFPAPTLPTRPGGSP